MLLHFPASYSALKLVHIGAVTISGTGFLIRGAGALRDSAWVRQRVVRILPHIVDTVLLLSAVGMLWVIRLSPWGVPWLRAKIVGLIGYILLGEVALRGRIAGVAAPRAVRATAWVAALGVLGYIISVALTKDPRGFVRLLR